MEIRLKLVSGTSGTSGSPVVFFWLTKGGYVEKPKNRILKEVAVWLLPSDLSGFMNLSVQPQSTQPLLKFDFWRT
jgi:hypothetical protein